MEGNGGLSHGHFSILGPQNELSHEIWDFRWNFYFRKGLQIPSNYHQKRSLLLPSPFFFRILRSDNFKKRKNLRKLFDHLLPPPLVYHENNQQGGGTTSDLFWSSEPKSESFVKIDIFSWLVFFETIYWEKTLHLTKKLTLGFEAFPLMCVNRRLEKRKKVSFGEKIANFTHHKVDFDGWRVLNGGGGCS